MTLKVIDRFTTRDGRWEVDERPYGLTKEMYDKYKDWNIPGRGGAQHIFVYRYDDELFVLGNDAVEFFTPDGKNSETRWTDSTGWCNFPVFGDGWSVRVNGVVIAENLGLPNGLHVSTFLVTRWVNDSTVPDEDPEEVPNDRRIIQVIVRTWINGEIVKEEITWQG
jgi:hypothetical protein